MRRIGFLNYDWQYADTAALISGMESAVNKVADMQLLVFNAFGSHSSIAADEDSFEIFHLVHMERFSGIILQGNRSWPVSHRQVIADEAYAMGLPVVSMNYPLKHAVYIGTDNYRAELEFLRTVFARHHIHKPVFVNGNASSQEAVQRAKAYYQVCVENAISEPVFIQADWEYEKGVEAAEDILKRFGKENLPDGVFCANDSLANAIETTFLKNGIRIPEDVIITGFDNSEEAVTSHPRISSVDRDYRTIGETAARTILDMIDGKKPPENVYSPVRYIFAGSTGDMKEDEEDAISQYFHADHTIRDFYAFQIDFQQDILNAESIRQTAGIMEKYGGYLKCRNTYLMINEEYLDHLESAESVRHYGNTVAMISHTGEEIPLKMDENHIYTRFDTPHLVPREAPNNPGLYVFYPLQKKDICIGYFVTNGISPLSEYGFMTIIFTLLTNAMENARKRYLLERMNQQLGDLYTHDSLSGLCNRFGLEREGEKLFEWYLDHKGEAAVIFIDMDDMKHINDTYGHEYGDDAIRETAEIIREAIQDEKAFAMRYGGDEFVIIGNRSIYKKVLKAEQAMVSRDTQPYHLSLSVGLHIVRKKDGISLSEAIKLADDEMYEMKYSHKNH